MHQRILDDCWLPFFWIVCNCVFACAVMCMYIYYICVFNLFCHITELCMKNDASGWWCSLRSAFLRRFSGKNRTKTSISFHQFPTSERHAIISLDFPWMCVKHPIFSQHVCLNKCDFWFVIHGLFDRDTSMSCRTAGVEEKLGSPWDGGTLPETNMT